MKSKAILISALIIAGCLLIFTGCEPNVTHYGAGEAGTTPLHTTPRADTNRHDNFTTTPHGGDLTTPNGDHTTPHDSVQTPHRTHENEAAAGENPAAFPFVAKELSAPNLSSAKIGWGLGKSVDSKNRPTDALSAGQKYGHLGAIFIDEKSEDTIYLTFDEGYENGYTSLILDALKEKNAAATFFVTYDYCLSEPELIKRMIDEGHEVANHSYSHPSFPDITDVQVHEEIMKLHDYVKENFDYEMRLIRFPRGEFSEHVLGITHELGYKSIFWSFAYVDWDVNNQPAADDALQKIKASTHPGAVILLHAVSSANAEILPAVLDYWAEQGLKLGLIE